MTYLVSALLVIMFEDMTCEVGSTGVVRSFYLLLFFFGHLVSDIVQTPRSFSNHQPPPPPPPPQQAEPCGMQYLELIGVQVTDVWFAIGISCVFLVVFRFLTYLSLRFLHREM